MKKILTALTLISLTACAHIQTDTQRIQASCVGITTAVQALTLNKDKLSNHQIEVIEEALDIASPICGEGPEPTADGVKVAAIQAVQQRLQDLAMEIADE